MQLLLKNVSDFLLPETWSRDTLSKVVTDKTQWTVCTGTEGAHTVTSAQEAPAPTCDPVLDLSLHLEGVHIDGPVPDETCTGDSPVGLAEPVLVVIISGKHTVL